MHVLSAQGEVIADTKKQPCPPCLLGHCYTPAEEQGQPSYAHAAARAGIGAQLRAFLLKGQKKGSALLSFSWARSAPAQAKMGPFRGLLPPGRLL